MHGRDGGPEPWALYAAGVLTNPNVLLAGVIGQGKSALAKSLALRSLAAGRRVYVPGDPKGEWAPVAAAVGGQVVDAARNNDRVLFDDVALADDIFGRVRGCLPDREGEVPVGVDGQSSLAVEGHPLLAHHAGNQ